MRSRPGLRAHVARLDAFGPNHSTALKIGISYIQVVSIIQQVKLTWCAIMRGRLFRSLFLLADCDWACGAGGVVLSLPYLIASRPYCVNTC